MLIYDLEMISIELKNEIYHRRANGKSYGSIAKEFNLSRSTVQRIILSKGKICKKRGPKDKITKFDKRKISGYINLKNEIGIKVSCSNILRHFELNIHRTTVLRSLKCLRYDYKNVPYIFKLSTKSKALRVSFAKKCLIENVNWQNVIFSDEKRFSLNGCVSFYTWIHSKQSPKRIRKVVRSPCVMVWAMVSPNGLISFRILKGNQNAENYINIIKNVVIPIAKLNLGKEDIYQHDNCPIHLTTKTKNFSSASNLKVLDWPAHSPDLNIIENL